MITDVYAKRYDRKGECVNCGVNLPRGYGYKAHGELYCVVCLAKKYNLKPMSLSAPFVKIGEACT